MQFLMTHIWIICLLALFAGVFTFFFGKRTPGNGAFVTIGAMAVCFAMSVAVFLNVFFHPETALTSTFTWFTAAGAEIKAGFIVDPLTAVMLVVVTLVSLLVQIYSTEYMHGDKGYSRYFSYLSTFTFAMLMLIITNNFFIMYIAWELVGLCSYLLIGFWFEKQSACNASKKAFITTKLGDIGFLLGLLLLYAKTKTFIFADLYEGVRAGLESGFISPLYLAVALICLFMGAVGKSAQFPLHVWLPDAMEGPTPVSALIHAATMVAAGVYLVGRAFPLFVLSKAAILFVAYTGAFTAIFAASIALVQTDIKKVLAYSTISQLGYMILGLGVGGYVSGLFHLMTHAFFKALLFLGSGSVIHALHNQDITNMGGLMKTMRITAITFLLGCLSIAGIPPFAGFFSKDAILAQVFELAYASPQHGLLFIMAITAAFMTAFYMFRLFFLTFTGELRDKHAHPHECGFAITGPLMVLAVLAVIAGFFANGFDGSVRTPVWTVSDIAGKETVSLKMLDKNQVAAISEPAEKKETAKTEKNGENANIEAAKTEAAKVETAAAEKPKVEAVPAFRAHKFRSELYTFEKPALTEHTVHMIHVGMMVASVIIASLGIFLAFLMYWSPKPFISPALLTSNAVGAAIHKLLLNKYYVDEIYAVVFVGSAKLLGELLFEFDKLIVDGFVNGAAWFACMTAEVKNKFDRIFVDGMVNGAGYVTKMVGSGFSKVQNGLVQNYLVLLMTFLLFALIIIYKHKVF